MHPSSCAKQVILPFIVVINTALFYDEELNELNTVNHVVLIHFTTSFEVVNVVDDLDFEEESSDIRVSRRRKQA